MRAGKDGVNPNRERFEAGCFANINLCTQGCGWGLVNQNCVAPVC